MKPYLIPPDFDLSQLCDLTGTPLFTRGSLALYVLTENPSIPTNNGIGVLADAITCFGTHQLNGEDELKMTYPITGQFFDRIEKRAIIVAHVETRGNQPYRIYRITKPLNGIVTVYARHLAYDLAGIPVEPFEASNIQSALSGIKTHSMVYNPFTFTSTRSTAARFRVRVPTSAWALMGGQQGSILDVYGGEYTFDGYHVSLENRVGADNGVSVRYGVNMTDLTQDENIANCYTGVVAYWANEEDVVYSPVISAGGTYGYVRILPVDMSDKWDNKPTVEQLKSAASTYITANEIGVPKVSWTVGFVPLDTTEEYKHLAVLQRVGIGDTVTVKFERLGVDASARVNKTVWDVLHDRYDSVSLGSVKANIADTIAGQAREIAKVPTEAEVKSITRQISTVLTKAILGADGGSIRFIDTNGDGVEDTLYVADNDDPAQAVNVWRWNYQGWAGSKNGYNGPFKLGATLEDGLLADFVTAAHLTAGTIQSQDGTTFRLNLDSGEMQIGGYAKSSDISDMATKTELATAGQTIINGGNITTGILNADLVKIISEGDIGSGFGNASATFNGQFLEGTQKTTAAPLWRLGTDVVDTGNGYVASGNLELYAVGNGIDNSVPVISIGALDGESWGIVIRDPYSGYTGRIEAFFNPNIGLYLAINDGTENTVTVQGDGGVVRCKRLFVGGTEVTP